MPSGLQYCSPNEFDFKGRAEIGREGVACFNFLCSLYHEPLQA